jgi:hypothetical protein
MSRRPPVVQLCLLLGVFVAFWLHVPILCAQQAGGMAAAGPQVHVVRSLVGAKGEQRNGSFVMTEPRSVFYIPEDREVIVYFEWEGTKGIHHCEGNVRGPSGQFATMSSFDYTATQPRFAGFWRVPLSESSPQGNWIFESRVDGEQAGQLTFQIVATAKPADVVKRSALPTPGELYKLTTAATVLIENLDESGHLRRRGSGFFLKDGVVVTSFRTIESARSLRLILADGKQVSSPSISAWNRRQDWAILSTPIKDAPALKLAESKTWNIGDHCSWLSVKADGTHILSDAQIVGTQSPASYGERIDFNGGYDVTSSGGALLNDQGEVIGVLGGALPESLVHGFSYQTSGDVSELTFGTSGIAIAATVLPQSFTGSPATLDDLWNKGQMMPAVSNSKYVMFGMLTQGQQVKGKHFSPADRSEQVTFHRGDSTASVLIHLANNDNLKSTAAIKLYDVDNHLLAAGKSEKISVSRGEVIAERMWQMPLTNLPVGIYRVDIEIADGVAWRQFFKVAE